MKLGIIIICNNNENDIDICNCVKYLNNVKNMEICLVNNNSTDNTYDVLREIKENCENVSIVNIKKRKSDNSAVKAGARFMSSQFNIKHLGFINTNMIRKYQNLSLLIKTIQDHQIDILEYNNRISNEKSMKQTMFQSLFSIVDYLSKINDKNEYNEMNSLG